MRDFIEWWAGLSPWIRFGAAILILLLSTGLWAGWAFLGWRGSLRLAVLGWALGIALLIFSFPSGPERKGYHDF